jgi:hypothetical protein
MLLGDNVGNNRLLSYPYRFNIHSFTRVQTVAVQPPNLHYAQQDHHTVALVAQHRRQETRDFKTRVQNGNANNTQDKHLYARGIMPHLIK